MRNLLMAAAAGLLLASCETAQNANALVGTWSGAEWLVDGKQVPARNAAATSFTFAEDGNYTYTNEGVVEKGLWKIQDDKLYTTPAGQTEMMVKIARVTKDSLVFDMNRGGLPETLTLVRK
ncbi:lipocalin family protein [Flaviaesturariibacter amylovorans]|uniref:Lipocalin-like domain-containing protein n=1 Tax=Flaviaesturariibacter amylovorans TaxID=1084520 RepID=A0ABP8HDZ0_9BACT